MTDNTRHEAIERAYDAVRNQEGTTAGLVEWVLDASSLLEQLDEADAQNYELLQACGQRDQQVAEAQDALKAFMVEAAKQLAEAKGREEREASMAGRFLGHLAECKEQLAAERALCDRLAETANALLADAAEFAPDPLEVALGDVLRDYDALRATERAT